VPDKAAEANLWANDDTLKTPHAYAVDFSVGRELPKRFSLQISYVGRFGHRLLTQRDLNQPLDIVDPKTGIDYYAAATALSRLARANSSFPDYPSYLNFVASLTDASIGPTVAYWQRHAARTPAGGKCVHQLFRCRQLHSRRCRAHPGRLRPLL